MIRGLVWVLVFAFACHAALADSKRYPVQEVITDAKPTAEFIASKYATGYASPRLLKARILPEEPPHADRVQWTFFYDGIELVGGAISFQRDGHWITRLTPQLSGPERVRRADLIGEAKAQAIAKLRGTMKSRLVYVAKAENKQIAGTTGKNAMDYERVIASWRFAYRVEDKNGGVFVDAYSGDVIERWSNWEN